MCMRRAKWIRAILSAAVLLPFSVTSATYIEKHSLSVTLDNGEMLDGQIYGRISPGGRWVLHVNPASGSGQNALTDAQVEVLIADLFSQIETKHAARLDSIRFDTAVAPTFQQTVIARLRDAPISDSVEVDQKSKEISAALQRIISDSVLVRRICTKATLVHRRCAASAVSINPVAFDLGHPGNPWAQVKSQPLAGLKPASLVFFIALEPG